jgi:hypothetical protein
MSNCYLLEKELEYEKEEICVELLGKWPVRREKQFIITDITNINFVTVLWISPFQDPS